MAQKGCPGPTTLHALLYVPSEVVDPRTGERGLAFLPRPDSPLEGAALVVVDEVSMIDGAIAADLLSYGCKVLVIGDPAQLPPVGGGGFFTSRAPDWMLTEVHRQAAESGILRLATEIRETGRYSREPGHYGDDVSVVPWAALDGDSLAELDGFADQVIVGTNRRRHKLNEFCRGARGLGESGPLPERLDKLVCLRNDARRGLQNGSLYRVESAGPHGATWAKMTIVSDDDGASLEVDVVAHAHHFLGAESALEKMDWTDRRARSEFDYGYAITCHKSQGSQWDKVMVIDESRVFRKDARAWLYTALTRASKELVLVTT